MKTNEVETRAYARPRMTKKVKYLAFFAVLLVAGTVTAAVLGPALTATQTVASVNLAFSTAVTPSPPDGSWALNSNPVFATVDYVGLDTIATGSAAFSNVYLTISLSNGGFSCDQFKAAIADKDGGAGGAGKISVAVDGSGTTYTQVALPSGSAPGCTFNTNILGGRRTVSIGTTEVTYIVAYQWNGSPIPSGTVSWTFTATQ